MGLAIDFVDDTDALVETELFRNVGELGLECLHYYAKHEDDFHSVVLEQQARPAERRCPLGRASAECVKILYDHYKLSQTGTQRGAAHFTPFMLNFPRLHTLVLKFFLRMWHDSESRVDDFERLSYLVSSQVRLTLKDEHTKTWLNLENDFLGTDYRNIRDCQMEMIDKEDGLLERPAVVDLRNKVSREAQEVMADQRWVQPAATQLTLESCACSEEAGSMLPTYCFRALSKLSAPHPSDRYGSYACPQIAAL